MPQPDEKLPQAVWEGTLRMFGVELRCYVLDDGQHLIHADDMHALLAVLENPETHPVTEAEMHRFVTWMSGGIPESEVR